MEASNYTKYSWEELVKAYENIDEKKFPEQAKAIIHELDKREAKKPFIEVEEDKDRQISRRVTYVHKFLIPALFTLIIVPNIFNPMLQEQQFSKIGISLGILFLLLLYLQSVLLKQVTIYADHILVESFSESQKIDINQIERVSWIPFIDLTHIKLKKNSKFGKGFIFMPNFMLRFPRFIHPDIEELRYLVAVNKARSEN